MGQDQVEVMTCAAKGKRCVAMDKKKEKWRYDAHSEAEAELMVDAVLDRGYILKKWWSQI